MTDTRTEPHPSCQSGVLPRVGKSTVKASIGPVSLMADISIEIAAGREGWITTFYRARETIVDDVAATEPWIDRTAPGRLSDLLISAVPEFDKKKVRDRLKECFSNLRESPDAEALISAPASRVIGETISVSIELSDPPYYVITLEGGNTLSFTAKEIAARHPITLNEKWLSVHPRQPLNATGRDFGKAIEFWLSIAEEVEPSGTVSPWEVIAEKLQDRVSMEVLHDVPEGLNRTGLYRENGTLWISNSMILDILRQFGKDSDPAGFTRYLKKAGYLVHPSKSFRIGNTWRRAWGFREDFRPSEPAIVTFASLDGE
jgi:hypothetical protein